MNSKVCPPPDVLFLCLQSPKGERDDPGLEQHLQSCRECRFVATSSPPAIPDEYIAGRESLRSALQHARPTTISFGQIWRVTHPGPHDPALAIITFDARFSWREDRPDVRVVCLDIEGNPDHVELRDDIVLKDHDSPLGLSALIETWNEISVLVSQLDHYLGNISSDVAQALHQAMDPKRQRRQPRTLVALHRQRRVRESFWLTAPYIAVLTGVPIVIPRSPTETPFSPSAFPILSQVEELPLAAASEPPKREGWKDLLEQLRPLLKRKNLSDSCESVLRDELPGGFRIVFPKALAEVVMTLEGASGEEVSFLTSGGEMAFFPVAHWRLGFVPVRLHLKEHDPGRR